MKLEHYKPTYRWVLLEPLLEEKVGSLYLPVNSQKATTYLVIKIGPQCEVVRPGHRVIVENGPMVDLLFQDKKVPYVQVLEPRIIGIDDDSTGTTCESESALPRGSV